jgi:dipeptidyl aminopeptidase/acylaminoacyl peptidase
MERLADALQDATDVTGIAPVALAAHPALPDQLFIGARVEGGTGAATSHIFVHNLATDEITELLQIDHNFEPHRSLHVSADGRLLFVHSVDRRASSWHLHLYNIRTGDILTYSAENTMAFPGYDLSADGEWLVRVDDGFLHLIPLNGGRQRLVAHDFAHCYAAVWVEGSFQ